jgi:hypothetical protein
MSSDPEEVPALNLAASTSIGIPLEIPWTNHVIKLGTGFRSAWMKIDAWPFCADAAFDHATLSSAMVFTVDGGEQNSCFQTSATFLSNSSEHIDMSFEASIGSSLLGASAQGSYSKKVMENDSVGCLSKTNTTLIFAGLS